ncbi:hypothetical protein UNDYM_3957 [Undibacterium sp. YM2]|uniref:hypothetical protein n=1 Tax=Undibacterium sp. YM2 TaxID=2058625 RepID=UPI001331D01D|nr:hypothetical protein [Undibacterium sp. YM2]BBB68210.1 hypothetical protein UNDYM_3957 [Undibacterium sp. YM2]
MPILSIPFDAKRHESGSLRNLYAAVCEYQGEQIWQEVFLAHWDALKSAGQYFKEIRDRDSSAHPWPDLLEGESMNLYCASRLSDLMLLSFQPGDLDVAGLGTTMENYTELFTHLGFEVLKPVQFHAFSCEIVDVIQSEGNSIELLEVLWPAFMLGNMMFARAGVRVKAPAHLLSRGIADCSCLYWAYRRKYRPANDLSHGWGRNSQWRTDFRRDFDLGDRYAYNVDRGVKAIDLRESIPAHAMMDDLITADRINLLKHRCITNMASANDGDYWPYDDYYEEVK